MREAYCKKTGKLAFSPLAFACVVAIVVCSFVFTGCSDGNTEAGVTSVAVTGVTLDETEFGLLVDGVKFLTATVQPANSTNKNVIWSSSPLGVVTVDNNGTVKAKSVGTAIITVITDDGRKRASCTVTVGTVPVESITLGIGLDTLDLPIGESQQLTPTILPVEAANKSVRWETSDFTKVAVTSNGTVYGVSSGMATITARTHNNKTATCIVTVGHEVVTRIILDEEEFDLDVWDKRQLSYTLEPINATFKGVTWSSSNDKVATVSNDGMVTGIGGGTAIISVTAKDNGIKANCEVTVVLPEVPEVPVVWISPDSFTMGSPETEPNRRDTETQHQVTLTKGFYMSTYHISQEVYQAITKVNPSFTRPGAGQETLFSVWPVDSVTWYDAVEFCNRLSTVRGYTPAYTITERMPETGYPIIRATVICDWSADGYRLPTEAEWEFACRAGTTTAFNFKKHEWEFIEQIEYADSWGDIIKYDHYLPGAPVVPTAWGSDYIWYDWANFDGVPYNDRSTSPNRDYYGRTRDGLYYKDYPNQWGLYNMHGNLEEWCWDWFSVEYGEASVTDPTGPATGSSRVLRGGSFYDVPWWVRSATRNSMSPGATTAGTIRFNGFRVVRFETPAP
jgi:uncharacterized protein YjdB/formylglycine-generating enzyme required for sulfatase activity